jgi:hypothetical protein
MTAEFSDPGWWPTPPPEAPKAISTPKLVLGTIVPLALLAALVAGLVSQRSHSSTSGRSLEAFESCLKDQGALVSSAESNDALLRQAALACRSHVPLLPRTADPQAAASQELQQCMKAASAKLRSGPGFRFGPFGAGPPSRRGYENAVATCQAESFVRPGAPGVTPGRGSNLSPVA